LAYLLVPANHRAVVADVSWTWARRTPLHVAPSPHAVTLIGSATGMAVDRCGLRAVPGGQLVWNYYELIRRVTRRTRRSRTWANLGVYVCFLIGRDEAGRIRAAPSIRPELLIDTVLVTLMGRACSCTSSSSSAVRPGRQRPVDAHEHRLSVGGVAVLWLILVELLPTRGFPWPRRAS